MQQWARGFGRRIRVHERGLCPGICNLGIPEYYQIAAKQFGRLTEVISPMLTPSIFNREASRARC
jgi:hypothetical protein